VNVKWLFEGGVPGETYGEGVRRRGKGILVTTMLVLVLAALIYVIFSLSGSIWLSMAAAALCGMASMRIGSPFDLPITKPSSRSDKVVWLVLFTPPLLVLAGASIYEARVHAVFQAACLSGLFGAVLGGTLMILLDAASRARVEGTTLATSADENR
jgi:hypothetical protein